MSIPSFTAEASLYNALGVSPTHRGGGTSPDLRDVVIPQFWCDLSYCYCSGYEDCYQMVYVRQMCYWPPSCVWSSNGIDCQCVWANV
jgi:hypothetical protein